MLLGSKSHTAGNTRRSTGSYDYWLDNAAEIERIDVQSSSATCTVSQPPQILGRQVAFFLNGGEVFLNGGEVDESVTVTLTMRDGVGNIKNDTIKFVCVAP
jgi:hypothetical protein